MEETTKFLVALACLQEQSDLYSYNGMCLWPCVLVDNSRKKYTTCDTSLLKDTILFLKIQFSVANNIQQGHFCSERYNSVLKDTTQEVLKDTSVGVFKEFS